MNERFLTEFTVRHPEDDNGVLLWHAGAPTGLKHPDAALRHDAAGANEAP